MCVSVCLSKLQNIFLNAVIYEHLDCNANPSRPKVTVINPLLLSLSSSAISRRKLDLPFDIVSRAINSLDLKTLSVESVELLQRMIPNDSEVG